MKLLSTIVLAMAFIGSASGQGTQIIGSTNSNINVSNINAQINTGGDLFNVLSGPLQITVPGFEVPKGSGKHTILTGALWLGGRDAGGQLYTASQTYRQPGYSGYGYWPGPITNNHNTVHQAKYDRIWKVTRTQIEDHILYFNNPLYITPPDILEWPGNGNTANGESAQLAPFVDINNDGIYSPNLGEYPKIKGDEAAYYILNDKGNVKRPITPAMNLEIHVMYYGYNNQHNSPVYNTLFTEYRIINRGA
jgi:hypothetical protein